MMLCYNAARRDHLTSTYQHGLQSQNVQLTAKQVLRGRNQSDCCHLLNIHSQETNVHTNVYSHSFRFRLEVHFLHCCASIHVLETVKAFQHIKK